MVYKYPKLNKIREIKNVLLTIFVGNGTNLFSGSGQYH